MGVVLVCFPPGKRWAQKVQPALLLGLIWTLECARLQYFWVKEEHSTPKKKVLHSLGNPGLSLAWKSSYGLSRLLSSRIDT